MSYALILNALVVQISDVAFEVAPPLEWVDITDLKDQPNIGWEYKDGEFKTPVLMQADPQPCCVTLTTRDGTMVKKVYLNDAGSGLVYEDVE